MDPAMAFDGCGTIGRTVVVGACAYVALVLLLRVSGKRTLEKLNAFDLVGTVAPGSTLGSVLTSRDVPLAQGVTAFTLQILLQFVVKVSADTKTPRAAEACARPRRRSCRSHRAGCGRRRCAADVAIRELRPRSGVHG